VDQGRQRGVDQAVTPFRAFIDPVPGLSAGEVQKCAREQLPQRVRESSLRWWSPDQALPTDSRFLLVGVAVWSGYDMNLLDHLNRAASASDTPVYVFDADSIENADQLETILPGIGVVHHTPIVGYWEDGHLVEKAVGFHARQIVAQRFGIDESLLHQRVTAAS
jgi:hypothetical protein